MRELILIAIVGGIALVSLFRPVVGLLGYVWFATLRPDVLAWSYGHYPYSMVLAGATAIGSLRYFSQFFVLFTNPFTQALLAFQIPLLISVATALDIELCYYNLDVFERMMLMSLLIVVLIRTEKHLKWLLMIMGFSLGVLGVKFGLYGVVNGGVRFAAGYGGMLSDNNDLALALVIAVPLCWYFRDEFKSKWIRMGLLGVIFCTIAAVVMTYSRGAAVALVIVMLLIAMRSKRKVGVLVAFMILAAPTIYLVGKTYRDRLATVADPEHEASSYSRIALAQAAFNMWQDYPLFGVGFGGGNCSKIVAKYTDAKEDSVLHNTYLQMLVDSGIFAFLIYVSILFGTILWLGYSARRIKHIDPRLARYPLAIQASLIGFAIGSTFLSRVNFDVCYMLICAAATWREVARAQTFETVPAALEDAAEEPVEAEWAPADYAYGSAE